MRSPRRGTEEGQKIVCEERKCRKVNRKGTVSIKRLLVKTGSVGNEFR